MTKTIKTLDALAAAGLLPSGATPELEAAVARLPVGITPALQDLIDASDPADPIRAQFVPSAKESSVAAGELKDPIGDTLHAPLKGIVHRYPDRLLLNPVTSCAAYCRFCFRREQVGRGDGTLTSEEIEAALGYIRAHTEIREVILSGGDPLTLSPRRLGALVAGINAVPHVEILRIHTRLPVVDPERITAPMVSALRGRLPVYLLLHCNHPRELGEGARAALALLSEAGVTLLSQSVLLAGVNDDIDTLSDLMRAFLRCRVVPHYIHHPDLAEGTGHFRLDVLRGLALMQALRARLSGLCQPHYILEIPGGGGKVPLSPPYAVPNEDGSWRLMRPDGQVFTYRDDSTS